MAKTIITLNEWMQWKEDIRKKLQETAQNFVQIGYRLKQIRDSGMYDGAADIFEFAKNEYGLGKSTVSRFIAINEKYSEGGNSLELKEEYRGFSSSKLSEMLTLPDSECELITEQTTIREIRDLKEFNRQEEQEQIPGQMSIEKAAHEVTDGQQEYTPLQKCIIDFFKDKKECLNQLMRRWTGEGIDERYAVELINPSGQTSHRKGIIYLFLYDLAGGVKYKQMGEEEIKALTWIEFLNEISKIYSSTDDTPGTDFYGMFYRKEVGKENETAALTSDEGRRKEDEISEKETGEEAVCESAAIDGEDHEQEEQIPGQDSILNHPEYMPDGMYGQAAGTDMEDNMAEPAAGVTAEETVATSQQKENSDHANIVMELAEEIRGQMDFARKMMSEIDLQSWKNARARLRGILDRTDVLIRKLDSEESYEE